MYYTYHKASGKHKNNYWWWTSKKIKFPWRSV